MSNEVINQEPSLARAKEFEQQAKEGLDQLKIGQDKVIIACHKMRDTKAYKVLGFDSYYAWGESALNLKKTRLNELAVAGEVQQELLLGMEQDVKSPNSAPSFEAVAATENRDLSSDDTFPEIEDDKDKEKDQDEVIGVETKPSLNKAPDLSEINTPQLIALAKAPKGERLAVLDMAATEAKSEDKPLTTSTIKEAVLASAKAVDYSEPSADEQAIAIKKQHKLAMGKVSKLNEELGALDTSQVNSEEVESWKTYLEEIKQSISALEQALGYSND